MGKTINGFFHDIFYDFHSINMGKSRCFFPGLHYTFSDGECCPPFLSLTHTQPGTQKQPKNHSFHSVFIGYLRIGIPGIPLIDYSSTMEHSVTTSAVIYSLSPLSTRGIRDCTVLAVRAITWGRASAPSCYDHPQGPLTPHHHGHPFFEPIL